MSYAYCDRHQVSWNGDLRSYCLECDDEGREQPPYREWCRHPERCKGLVSCPLDPSCAD